MGDYLTNDKRNNSPIEVIPATIDTVWYTSKNTILKVQVAYDLQEGRQEEWGTGSVVTFNNPETMDAFLKEFGLSRDDEEEETARRVKGRSVETLVQGNHIIGLRRTPEASRK